MTKPLRHSRGFSLIETMIALAILTTILLVTMSSFAQKGGRYETNREQVTAYLVMARAHAATNGSASGLTGATVQATYDALTDETTLSLYDGRPFGGTAAMTRVPLPPEIVRGDLTYGRASGSSHSLAIFVGASGATSATNGYDVSRPLPIVEPRCDYETGLDLTFANGGTSRPIVMSCATGEITPDPDAPSQRSSGPDRRAGSS